MDTKWNNCGGGVYKVHHNRHYLFLVSLKYLLSPFKRLGKDFISLNYLVNGFTRLGKGYNSPKKKRVDRYYFSLLFQFDDPEGDNI